MTSLLFGGWRRARYLRGIGAADTGGIADYEYVRQAVDGKVRADRHPSLLIGCNAKPGTGR
jgi:3-dehydroquinate synthase class II